MNGVSSSVRAVIVTDAGRRISPVMPFNVVSYALGVTRVRFRDYLLGTTLGAILPMALYTTIGASVGDLAALLAGEGVGFGWVQVAGVALTVVATVLVTRVARSALAEALARRSLASA